MPLMLKDETFYTVAELAEKLSLNIATVRNFIKSNRLHAVKIGNRYYSSESDLLAFFSQAKRPGKPKQH